MARIYDKNPKLLGKDPDVRSRRYITPCRIVWTSRENGADVANEEFLLTPRAEQLVFADKTMCVLKNTPGKPRASVLVDYGTELHGTVRVMLGEVTGEKPDGFFHQRANIRIHLGESAMEAMSDIGVKNATNDHSNRDFSMEVGGWSAPETGESGFRFMRIELLDEEASLAIKSVNATFIFRDVEYKGSFDCSDPLLNRIWDTAAYTVQLNMQEYLWDGIKRDRLVWIGDMHTEVMTILSAFGYNEVVPKSLDLAREDIPVIDGKIYQLDGFQSYAIWWLLLQYEWYMGTGNRAYLEQHKAYLCKLAPAMAELVDEQGGELLEQKFLDWPTCTNPQAQHAGMQGLLKMGLEKAACLMKVLDEPELAGICEAAALRMAAHLPSPNGSKAAGALLVLGGLADAEKMNEELIAVGGAQGFSTFQGYYLLKAMAMAGNYQGALDAMREYWGGMLKMGATTFWEDFDLAWMENAAPIDDLVPAGKIDVHGDWGAYCYQKFRHSLCHGWASGPCPFMTQYILGVQVLSPGCKKLHIEPHLCDLSYAKGTYPTPYGVVSISHVRQADGSVKTDVKAPREVEIVV